LLESVAEKMPPAPEVVESDVEPEDETQATRVAIVGKPNVGKSSFVNAILNEQRTIVDATPGTTRDALDVEFRWQDRDYLLIDTAGMRRRSGIKGDLERFSVSRSLRAVRRADVVLMMMDGTEGITDQDLHLLGLVLERGKALTIGVNKWDHLDVARRRIVEGQVERKLPFVSFARVSYVSAKHGSGIDGLIGAALAAFRAAGATFPTPRLNEILERALAAHAPPIVAGRRLRLRYAHQGGRHPPIIVVHGGRAERVPTSYRRYLTNAFREALDLEGAPLRLEFRSADNPFAGRRNPLTRRQVKRRQRVMRHRR